MLSRTLEIDTSPVFKPFDQPARYKGAWGGRGSGKSHDRAEALIEDAICFPGEAGEGLRALCVREVQKSLKQSAKLLIEDKLTKFRLGERDGFKVFASVIETPGGGLIDFQGMQDHTADSIKSYEGFHRAWMEEAHTISPTSLNLLRPTIRWEDTNKGLTSEIWATWNPRRKTDAIDLLLRSVVPPNNSIVLKANWSDNPWFPKVLEEERQYCLAHTPEQYDHIWEGGYATVLEGAYYAKAIQEARLSGRIDVVPADPLMTIRLFVDIGGTGAKADAFTIWAAQFIGKSVRVIDYYEAVGQDLATHLNWMREKGYTHDKAQIWLPHDGTSNDKVYNVSYESALTQAGYKVTIVPNQGKGAAKARIESARRTFPAMSFNEKTTQGGLEALGWYHERRDETRNLGLGPEHDWSSHGADSYGLMSIVFEEFLTQTTEIVDPYKGFRKLG